MIACFRPGVKIQRDPAVEGILLIRVIQDLFAKRHTCPSFSFAACRSE
jgi:hypothetical protein